ncbi:MAG: hypothetical protein JW984_08320 [Deltaproteobacteria bacterium]|uniref:RsbT co-antagonist protein RsbRD N-terminal domain-containing protein n=1 Tax=Candidatus Zymogenus saltonus TaxID=2844893 RepID=A0A9D8PP75_9DELT|nr:hypothetical protein [Candidatus Zymogenus saltonus]
MISEKFVKLIEENAKEITDYWINDIHKNESTPSFHEMAREECMGYGMSILKELGNWLDEKDKGGDVKDIYIKLGQKRAIEPRPLSDVVSAQLLLKRHIWLYVLSHGFLSTTYELYQILEVNNRVVDFFDRLIFYLIYGYELETTAKIDRMADHFK